MTVGQWQLGTFAFWQVSRLWDIAWRFIIFIRQQNNAIGDKLHQYRAIDSPRLCHRVKSSFTAVSFTLVAEIKRNRWGLWGFSTHVPIVCEKYQRCQAHYLTVY